MNKGVLHLLIIILLDLIIIAFSGFLALTIRFDFSVEMIPQDWMHRFFIMLPVSMIITVVVFYICHMYHFVWHFVNTNDVARMITVIFCLEVALIAISYAFNMYMPRSVAFMNFVFKLILFVAMRCSIRFYNALVSQQSSRTKNERIMLIGAGDAGNVILKELQQNRESEGRVCCIIDDNPVKKGKKLFGIRIIGGRECIAPAVKEYRVSKIVFAIPTASKADKKEILGICAETGVEVKALPSIYQLYNDEVSIKKLKDVEIEDLLGRDPIELDTDDVKDFVQGKTILVTGGGGSIGSELCRQIACNHPKSLIILDIYENNVYDIQQELKRHHLNDLNISIEIASIRDEEKIDVIFDKYRPDIVFHAAAHKHVPLMEDCPDEAVKNNIFGTYNIVQAAERYHVKKFIMISTDKAVNPTNVMGATKRFCEMILQSKSGSTTEYASVRFGNVLGSNGSVIPLFKKQIAEGGPVTITDKRIIRYFMTIPEAVQLVLEAGVMAKQSQIFVLDMGEPVKILDLAINLIRLSGLEPYKDIEIKEIGLRPGEKLYEELLMASENLVSTDKSKIFIEEQREIDESTISNYLTSLHQAISDDAGSEEIKELLKQMIPTYKDSNEINV